MCAVPKGSSVLSARSRIESMGRRDLHQRIAVHSESAGQVSQLEAEEAVGSHAAKGLASEDRVLHHRMSALWY